MALCLVQGQGWTRSETKIGETTATSEGNTFVLVGPTINNKQDNRQLGPSGGVREDLLEQCQLKVVSEFPVNDLPTPWSVKIIGRVGELGN